MQPQNTSYEESIKLKMADESLFDVEKWYEHIKDYTFRSIFLPISIEEGLMLREKYKIENKTINKTNLSAEHVVLYEKLKNNISETLKANFGEKPVFIRLSTRSPKDVASVFEDPSVIEKSVEMAIKFLKTQGLNKLVLANRLAASTGKSTLVELLTEKETNLLVRFMLNSGKDHLKVEGSAEKVLSLLANSERVSIDLHRMLVASGVKEPQRNHVKEEFSQVEYGLKQKTDQLCNIIFREWIDIADEEEFRCFYYGRKLTAISQYNYYIFIDELQEKKEQERIQSRIQALFDIVKERLPEENGVIDFQVTSDNTCRVIELNPFNKYEGGGTGGALFRWREDWEVLTKGPLEFRATSEVYPELRNKLELFGMENMVVSAINTILGEDDRKRNCNIF